MELKVFEKDALKAYGKADESGKKLLKDLFGEKGEKLFSLKITDRVKSFEDVCAVLGISTTLPTFPETFCGESKAMIAHYKLVMIARALNEGWKPNWGNSIEYKYYPWFEQKNGSLSFAEGDAYWKIYTHVGSRLCLKTKELAEYAGKQFESTYKEYFEFQ